MEARVSVFSDDTMACACCFPIGFGMGIGKISHGQRNATHARNRDAMCAVALQTQLKCNRAFESGRRFWMALGTMQCGIPF
jgi:hypothetical protein